MFTLLSAIILYFDNVTTYFQYDSVECVIVTYWLVCFSVLLHLCCAVLLSGVRRCECSTAFFNVVALFDVLTYSLSTKMTNVSL